MIEKLVLDYLNACNLGCPVLMEIPEDPPVKMIIVEKTGSGKTDHIERATLAFKSYASSLYEAARLNEELKEKVEAMPETQNIFSAKLNSDYNYTDTRNKKYRYQAVYDFTF